MPNWFYNYFCCFEAEPLIRQFAVPGLKSTPGFVTNFMGIKMDTKFAPVLADRGGQVEPVPIPVNWHADIAEWAAALRAVDIAPGPEFAVVELGCGWGCWMNNAGTAAKQKNLFVKLIGVEGDEGHCQFAHESLQTNGFKPDEYEVHRGIAAAKAGTALFPRQKQAGLSWGLQPIFNATEEQIAEAKASNSCDVLPTISLADVFGSRERIDLLHVDIQGGELDLVKQSIALLNEKVAYLLIGAHSRQIEGGLFDILLKHGWQLEIERPALIRLRTGKRPVIKADGLQGWRNVRLQKKSEAPTIRVGRSYSLGMHDFLFMDYFLGAGWSKPEKKHVWSVRGRSELKMRFASRGRKKIFFDLAAFIPTADFHQQIEVFANGFSLGKVNFKAPAKRRRYYFIVPARLGEKITFLIRVLNPISPQEAGTSVDARKLGVALYQFGLVDPNMELPGQKEQPADEMPEPTEAITVLPSDPVSPPPPPTPAKKAVAEAAPAENTVAEAAPAENTVAEAAPAENTVADAIPVKTPPLPEPPQKVVKKVFGLFRSSEK